MIISPMTMYLIVMLDNILKTLAFLTVVTGFALGVLLFALLVNYECIDLRKTLLSIIKPLCICFCFMVTLITFVPDTKQFATIILVPAIVNNEKIQDIGNGALNSIIEMTKDWLVDKKTVDNF